MLSRVLPALKNGTLVNKLNRQVEQEEVAFLVIAFTFVTVEALLLGHHGGVGTSNKVDLNVNQARFQLFH